MMDSRKLLLEGIVRAARQLPPEILEQVADKIERMPPDSTIESAEIAESFGQPAVRSLLLELLERWKLSNCTAQSLAWALRSASSVDEYWTTKQALELVWSGPKPPSSSLRRIDQALLDLITGAKHSLWIVTFAAYKIPAIAEALADAAERNVRIYLILESCENSEGKLAFDSLRAFGNKLNSNFEVFLWPKDRRPVDSKGNFGVLHIKCAVADDCVAIISSANFTESAFNLNMELGLMISGGNVPSQLSQHVCALISEQVLIRITI